MRRMRPDNNRLKITSRLFPLGDNCSIRLLEEPTPISRDIYKVSDGGYFNIPVGLFLP